MHTWYTYRVRRRQRARPGCGGRDVGQAGAVGAPGAGADVRLPAAGGVRGAHRCGVAAQRRAGLHHADPAGARRPGRGGRCRRGGPRAVAAHRRRTARGRHLVHHPGAPHPAPARRARDQAGARGHRARRRRRHADPAAARRDDDRAPGLHPAQAHRRRVGAARRPRLEPGARLVGLRRRGRDPLARPLRGPGPARGRRARRAHGAHGAHGRTGHTGRTDQAEPASRPDTGTAAPR